MREEKNENNNNDNNRLIEGVVSLFLSVVFGGILGAVLLFVLVMINQFIVVTLNAKAGTEFIPLNYWYCSLISFVIVFLITIRAAFHKNSINNSNRIAMENNKYIVPKSFWRHVWVTFRGHFIGPILLFIFGTYSAMNPEFLDEYITFGFKWTIIGICWAFPFMILFFAHRDWRMQMAAEKSRDEYEKHRTQQQ